MNAQPIYFIDHCLGGKALAEGLRKAGVTVELLSDHFERDVADAIWIPQVVTKGWIILTKDQNILRNISEREAILQSQSRMFTLTRGDMMRDDIIHLFLTHLDEMNRICNSHIAPFVYEISASGLELLHPRKGLE